MSSSFRKVYKLLAISLLCGSYNGVMMKEFTLTKQISKQGTNTLIVIPKFLQDDICAGDLVEVKIKVFRSKKVSIA